MENNFCRVHQGRMLIKWMNGGWTTVCPWCEIAGKYDKGTVRAGIHEHRGYQYNAGQNSERPDVSSRETIIIGEY